MSYKCPFCEHILSTRSSYSQHVSICLKIAEEDKIVTDMNDMSIESEEVFNPIEEVYVNLINIIFDFNWDLCQDSQDFSDYSSILSSEKDLTYLSKLSEQNILGSESSANQSMLISGSFIISENILEEVKESEVNTEYPNLVYAEFMTLITKHKINNTAGK